MSVENYVLKLSIILVPMVDTDNLLLGGTTLAAWNTLSAYGKYNLFDADPSIPRHPLPNWKAT